MAQSKTSNPSSTRVGLNREQSRRGVASAVAPAGRPAAPLAGAAGRGGRRGGSPVNFIRDVRSELRKVVWPTGRETFNLTVVVLAFSIAIGLLLGGVDYLFQEFFRLLLSVTGNGGF